MPGSKWTTDEVFRSLGRLVEEFESQEPGASGPAGRGATAHRRLLHRKRAAGWRPARESADEDALALEEFLVGIGYLEPQPDSGFTMTTPQLDPEMDQNGPELVTPVTNASMAVGGANARWGSLYDAYYLSDIHPEIDRRTHHTARLKMVVEETNRFLDRHVAQWEGGATFDDLISYRTAQRRPRTGTN